MAEVTSPASRVLEARTRVVTQTITRPFTTITALVTLGDGPSSTLPTDAPTSAAPTSAPPTTTSIDQIAPAASSSSLTPQQLGALLGSVLGFALLVLLLCCYLSLRRRQLRQKEREYARYYAAMYGDDDDEEEEESEVVQVRTRYRGTPQWALYPGGRGTATAAAAAVPVTGTGAATSTWTTVPPPVRFPPTPRYTSYSQTRERQIRGVRRYP